MGSAQSHAAAAFRPQYTRMEEKAPSSSSSSSPASQNPAILAQKGDAPPPLVRVESFSDKLIRKVSRSRLVLLVLPFFGREGGAVLHPCFQVLFELFLFLFLKLTNNIIARPIYSPFPHDVIVPFLMSKILSHSLTQHINK